MFEDWGVDCCAFGNDWAGCINSVAINPSTNSPARKILGLKIFIVGSL